MAEEVDLRGDTEALRLRAQLRLERAATDERQRRTSLRPANAAAHASSSDPSSFSGTRRPTNTAVNGAPSGRGSERTTKRDVSMAFGKDEHALGREAALAQARRDARRDRLHDGGALERAAARCAPNSPAFAASMPSSSSHQPEIFTITGLRASTPTRQVTAPSRWPMCTCHASYRRRLRHR